VIHQHKLEQLEYIINNTTSPVLVAYHFQSDKAQIIDYFTKAGIDVRPFDGSPSMIHEWNAGKIPVMLLQPQSAGHGINIQEGGHTLVWYTVPQSLEHYIQTNGRLYRQGQKYPVVIHHLLTRGTIDAKILNNINNKDMSEKALLDAVSATIDSLDDMTE
jgi:SNF2 family DNA or RNA helicase